MEANLARLSQRDVELLAADPNPANRQDAMLRVAELYSVEPLSQAERQIALAIVQTVLPEAELEIRRRLSETLKSTPHLDRALARQLAEDVLDVATPILVHSVVLTDEDLVQVIEHCSVDHARAVAMRPALNVAVTDALIRTDDEAVVVRVAANNNARISAGGFHHILDRFGDHARIAEAVSNRPALPLAIVERMATLVTGRTLERLIGRYAVPAHRVAMILHHSREHFLLQSIAGEPAEELRAFAQRLEDNRLLGPTLIMRAIAIGQFGFLLQALSIKANVPISNVRKLMADEGGRGQAELFEHCGLDPVYRPLFVDLAYAARNFPATRDGKAPPGWLELATPILRKRLQNFDADWSLEQIVTEALIEIEEERAAGNPGGPSSLRASIWADKTGR
jgi:uncharacterized protein (DUF2336 family)